jgi:hypothetical protein
MLTAGNTRLVDKWHYLSINIIAIDAGTFAKVAIE